MGYQQAEGPGGPEPTPPGAEPQVQPTAGAAPTAHGPAECRQNGRERLRWHHVVVVTARQHDVPAPGQQHRFHAVSLRNDFFRTFFGP